MSKSYDRELDKAVKKSLKKFRKSQEAYLRFYDDLERKHSEQFMSDYQKRLEDVANIISATQKKES